MQKDPTPSKQGLNEIIEKTERRIAHSSSYTDLYIKTLTGCPNKAAMGIENLF